MLNHLLGILSERVSSDVVFNQYLDKGILNNLRLYFEYLFENPHDIFLVGEAPGYQGCRLTGIPFTSGEVIVNSKHKFFEKIRDKIILDRVIYEPTAQVLWDFLNNRSVPVIWNAFPFHPHKSGLLENNRKPIAKEIKEGREYLRLVFEIFKPKILCGLGRVGENALKQLFSTREIIYIRHPARGGKNYFLKGIQKIFS
jgi:hypothetical protein